MTYTVKAIDILDGRVIGERQYDDKTKAEQVAEATFFSRDCYTVVFVTETGDIVCEFEV